ncbi:unnamed protein product [Rotaria magnacalcarata]
MSSMNRSDEFKLIRNIPVRQLPVNRSGITLVWLENALSPSHNESQTRLHSLANRCFIVYYSSISKCMKYLKQARSREYVIAISVSYPIETVQRIIYRLQQYRVIQAMLIVPTDRDEDNHLPLTNDNLHIFRSQQSMFEVLEKRIEEIQTNNLNGGLFTTFYRNEKALKNVRDDLASFVWFHAFKVLLMHMPHDSLEAKREMLSECRAYYRNDAVQLDEIDDFARNYQSKDAIRWYTKPGFLFYLVNKALRIQDIWALYKFRYFIIDLCYRLEEASNSQSFSSIQVYRGAKINQDELEQLQVGCLIATNSFLSCSSECSVAEMFIATDQNVDRSHRDKQKQFVLLIIDVDGRSSTKPVMADISHESQLPDENEILFNFGSTFIIDEIYFDNDRCIWLIKMRPILDSIQINREYEKYIHIRLQNVNSTILLGQIFSNICSDFCQSMSYFHRLLRILPIDHIERPNIYYNLGRIYRLIEKFDKSLYCFRCALLLIRRRIPERIFDYCRILGAIGTIYSYLGDSEQAVNLLKQALILQKKSFADNHTEIPFHLNRLGYGYFKAKKYVDALSILQSAENFFRTKMPVDHVDYGQTLHIMGLVYRILNDDDKALLSFQRALLQRYSLLGKDHPYLASTYYQLSLIYNDRGKYELALDYVQKCLNIQLIKLQHNHSEIKLSRELLRRIQQQQ